MKKEELKKILIAIIIGALTAFFSSLFDGFLELLKNHGNDIVGGGISAIYYLIRNRG